MDLIRAHGLFAMRRAHQRTAFEVDCTIGEMDAWPAACTAAVMLTGHLHDACSDDDLNYALEEFESLHNAGAIDDEEWRQATLNVLEELFAWGAAQSNMGGASAIN